MSKTCNDCGRLFDSLKIRCDECNLKKKEEQRSVRRLKNKLVRKKRSSSGSQVSDTTEFWWAIKR